MTRIPYDSTLSQGVPAYPPYYVSGVTVKGFFLKANASRLAYFIDCYLNVAPPEVAFFRPAAPYVLLLVSSQRQSGQAPRSGGIEYGFVAENQVSFMIPLLWYRKRGRRLELLDVAAVIPFGYSSDPSSVSIMGSMLGWTNTIGWLGPVADPGCFEPDSWVREANLYIDVIPALWQGRRSETRRLLEILREPPWSLEAPPSFESPWNPLRVLPNLVEGALSTAGDLAALLSWWCSSGLLEDPAGWLRALGLTGPFGRAGRGAGLGNLISLKQVRDTEDPAQVCYQALLVSDSRVTQVHRFGLLGSPALLRGDLSGGYRVRVDRYEAQPVVSRLGLETAIREKGRDSEGSDLSFLSVAGFGGLVSKALPTPQNPPMGLPRTSVEILKPVLPFWMQCDLVYSAAAPLCWRLRRSPWLVPGRGRPAQQVGAAPAEGNPYNMSLGTAVSAPSGPYTYSEVTARILPLRACRETLQKLCDRCLNLVPEHRFEAWGGYVLLMATDFGLMTSASENVGSWPHRDVELAFPVRWSFRGKPQGLVLFAPYTFSNSLTSTLTNGQIFGANVQLATCASPADTWMEPRGPAAGQPLLHLWAYTYPSLTLGTYPRRIVLAEVIRRPPYSEDESVAPAETAGDSAEGSELGPLRELGAEVLAGRRPLPMVNPKQVPAANLSDGACFQSLAYLEKSFREVRTLRPLPGPLHVRIHQNPLFPLVEMLGLKVHRVEMGMPSEPGRVWQGDKVFACEPVSSFWLTGTYEVRKAFDLCWRAAGAPRWHLCESLDERLAEPDGNR